MQISKRLILSCIFFLTALVLYGAAYYFWIGKEHGKQILNLKGAIHLAYVGALEDPATQSPLKAIKLYIENINEQGGVGGRKLVLEVYDDKGDPEQAAKIANTIVTKTEAVAVIGHSLPETSKAAGQVYMEGGIPAVAYNITWSGLTPDNEWYFRVISAQHTQVKYLALNARHVYNASSAAIVYDSSIYDPADAQVFSETMEALGGKTILSADLANATDKPAAYSNIVSALKAAGPGAVVFLAASPMDAVEFVAAVRDSGLDNKFMVPFSVADESDFRTGFDFLPLEVSSPGYYTSRVKTVIPFSFQNRNFLATQDYKTYKDYYQEEPAWTAAFAHDAVAVVVDAIKPIVADMDTLSKQEVRSQVRDLMMFYDSIGASVLGSTGYNFFDMNRDPNKPGYLASLKSGLYVPEMVQFEPVTNTDEVYKIADAIKTGRIVSVDKLFLYRSNIVHSGVKYVKIDKLDFSKRTVDIDFYLWFRYQGDIDVANIVFLNASVPPELKEPIKSTSDDGVNYRLYHVQGTFMLDFLPPESPFHQHKVGISFVHNDLSNGYLRYVVDDSGLGVASIAQYMETVHPLVVNPEYGYTIHDVNYFSDNIPMRSLGDPVYLGASGGRVNFSNFNSVIEIREESFTLRGALTPEQSLALVGICLLLWGLDILNKIRPTLKVPGFVMWTIRALVFISLALAAEVLVVDYISSTDVTGFLLHRGKMFFSMMWWIVSALLLNSAVSGLVWGPLEQRTGRKVPMSLRYFVSTIVFMMGIICIIAFVFDQKITSLLATSGMVAMIIGLAIQINITNIFSGIAISMERPFRMGDYVKIDGHEIGQVVDLTWRTTRIRIPDGTVMSVPNSTAAEGVVKNFSYPDDSYSSYKTINIDPAANPERVIKVLIDAMLISPGVKSDPMPSANFRGITGWSAEYSFGYTMDKFDQRFRNDTNVMTNIWRELSRNGIRLAIQNQEVRLLRPGAADGHNNVESIIESIDMFKAFSHTSRSELKRKLVAKKFAASAPIVNQGDEGSSLFVIADGVLGVYINKDNKEIEVARLGPGKFFGEKSLLTGEHRSATVRTLTASEIYEITKQDIEPLLASEPVALDILSKVLAARQAATATESSTAKEAEESLSQHFMHIIGKYFNVGS